MVFRTLHSQKKGQQISFLVDDLKICHAQLNKLEEFRLSIFKFIFTFYISITVASFTFINYISKNEKTISKELLREFKPFIVCIMLISFIAGLWFVYLLIRKQVLYHRYLSQMESNRKQLWKKLSFRSYDYVTGDERKLKYKKFHFRLVTSLFITITFILTSIIVFLSCMLIFDLNETKSILLAGSNFIISLFFMIFIYGKGTTPEEERAKLEVEPEEGN